MFQWARRQKNSRRPSRYSGSILQRTWSSRWPCAIDETSHSPHSTQATAFGSQWIGPTDNCYFEKERQFLLCMSQLSREQPENNFCGDLQSVQQIHEGETEVTWWIWREGPWLWLCLCLVVNGNQRHHIPFQRAAICILVPWHCPLMMPVPTTTLSNRDRTSPWQIIWRISSHVLRFWNIMVDALARIQSSSLTMSRLLRATGQYSNASPMITLLRYPFWSMPTNAGMEGFESPSRISIP